jgi:hypothetical protein
LGDLSSLSQTNSCETAEVKEGLISTDGTFSERERFYTRFLSIPDTEHTYKASFKKVNNSVSVYSGFVSVAYFGANGFISYDSDYYPTTAGGTYTDAILQVPNGTTKIALYEGDGSTPATITYDSNFVDRFETLEKDCDSIPKDSVGYTIEPVLKQESGAIKNDGTIDDAVANRVVLSFAVNQGCLYTVDVNYVEASNENCVSIAYYDKDGNFISSELPHKVSDNDGRVLRWNHIPSIPSNAAVMKIYRRTANLTSYGSILRRYSQPSVLFGKKLCVIGDSISTQGVYLTPFLRITPSMVGTQISTYVTSADVNSGTTIGGVTVDASMNDGALHTFTPTNTDIGKSIGSARRYGNNDSLLTWDNVLARMLGARVVANASYSGSTITTAREVVSGSDYTNTAAWKDYTISRCKDYSPVDYDNEEIPDVIIVYRGTNDFSYTDYSTSSSMKHLTLDDLNLSDGFDYNQMSDDFVEGFFQFQMAYFACINKLRETYPKALVCCATLNVFKRVIYETWPTRNYAHTLPDFNSAIRKIANIAGCPLIELDKDGITWQNCYSEGYITDSATTPTHPNQKGHWVMGMKAAADLNYTLSTNVFSF